MKGNSPENYIFTPGTIAYGIYLGKKDKKEKCKVCNGKKEIKLNDGKKYSCPACSGIGYHWMKTPNEWMLDTPFGREITQISVYKKEIVYFFSCNGFKAQNVFATKAQAEKEIAKRNKKLQQIQDEKEALEVYEN